MRQPPLFTKNLLLHLGSSVCLLISFRPAEYCPDPGHHFYFSHSPEQIIVGPMV